MADTRTIDFDPAGRSVPPIRMQPYTLGMPKPTEQRVSGPRWQRLIPIAVVVMAVVMVVAMMAMGIRRFNPLYLMFPVMMMISLLGLARGGVGGADVSDLNGERGDWFLAARETRKQVRAQGAAIHRLAVTNFPNPSVLSNLSAHAGMWQVSRDKKYNEMLPKSASDDHPLTDHPFMSARAGVGLAKLAPGIQHGPINVPESYEPVTASAFGRFLQVQKYVANTPIGIRFDQERSYGFRGDDPALRVDAVRPMVMSLAHNHSPNELAIGVVCDTSKPEVVAQWEWVKWLPHSNNTMVRVDETLPHPRLAWSSLGEFSTQMASDIAARRAQGSAYRGPSLIVFIDTPSDPVAWPANMTDPVSRTLGVPGITLVAVRFSEDRMNSFKVRHANLIRVGTDGAITVSERVGTVKMDRVSLVEADNFARDMARYRPLGFGTGAVKRKEDVERVPSWYSFLGIEGDLEDFDPRVQWSNNALTPTFRSPIGYKFDMAAGRRKPFPMMLDMIEFALGGTGPHGLVQGITGAGKSFLLQGIVLSLCALYGPDKVSLILADFKGGAAFDGYEALPHVIAVLTNLEEEKELIDRADLIINGEIIRRQRLLRQFGCANAVEYRNARHAAGYPDNMPPLPALFIVVDEFYEFIKNNRQYTRLFSSAGAVGRSIDIHMIPCSQFMDESLLGDLSKHIMFGISLTSADASYSRKVIGTDDAVKLKKGSGQALIRHRNPDTEMDVVEGFIGFNHAEPHVTKGETLTYPADPAIGGSSDTVLPFGLIPTKRELLASGSSETKIVETVKTHDVSLHDALLAHLCKFQEVQAPTLWQPSITVPMTLADTTTQQFDILAEKGDLNIRMGDLDNPLQHARPPFVLSPRMCVGVFGDAGTGKSTAIMTMVASTALSHKDEVSWSLIDYRGGCSAVEDFPNVAAYAGKHDVDIIARIIGEGYLKLAARERLFADNRISDTGEFIRLRRANPEMRKADSCGYMMIAIDGIEALVAGEEGATMRDQLINLALNGPRYGIFIVASAPSPEGLTHRLAKHFGSNILLKMHNPSHVALDGGLEAKAKLKSLPDQPGRGIDPVTGLPSLIMSPRATAIEPETPAGKGTMAKYTPVNSTEAIRALGNMLSRRIPRVEKLAVIGGMYTYAQMWEGAFSIGLDIRSGDKAPKDRWIPLGVDVGNLSLAYLCPHLSPHLIIAGDPDSGRTATLRELITAVTNQYSPSEARFVVADPSYRLLNEVATLVEDGYMNMDNFATDAAGYERIAENLSNVMQHRMPKETPSPSSVVNRDWFKGPEIFVLVNAHHQISSGVGAASGPLSGLGSLIREAPGRGGNLGVHFYVATDAKGMAAKLDREKLLRELCHRQAPILMLSGPSDEIRITPEKLKFEKRRPGRGLLYVPNAESGMSTTSTVQVAWTDPMEPVS